MKWFGSNWGYSVYGAENKVEAPVGKVCVSCDEPIAENDRGFVVPMIRVDGQEDVAMHHECHTRGIIGGVNHQLGRCVCCGGTEDPDPPGMTRREAAQAAVKLFFDREVLGNGVPK